MCRDAQRLYYPVVESVKSALPLVDEFVMVVGKGEGNDRTLELLQGLNEPKLRIIESEWDLERYPKGTVHAQQTDLAKAHCTGDWLVYLQADEVLHENDLPNIKAACQQYADDARIEGLLLDYYHFWGDYDHLQDSHSWYNKEIRVIRNHPDIHSWKSAQSFRRMPGFDGEDYRREHNTYKLGVKQIDAKVYHYGWVRPPVVMSEKINQLDRIHSHRASRQAKPFGFGDLSKLRQFDGTHPAVMHERISEMNWEVNAEPVPPYFRQNKWSAKLLTALERGLFPGKRMFGSKNYKLIR